MLSVDGTVVRVTSQMMDPPSIDHLQPGMPAQPHMNLGPGSHHGTAGGRKCIGNHGIAKSKINRLTG